MDTPIQTQKPNIGLIIGVVVIVLLIAATAVFLLKKGPTGNFESEVVVTEDGTYRASGKEGGSLISGFPADFPVMPGMKLISSGLVEDLEGEETAGLVTGSKMYVAEWETDKTVAEVMAYYQQELPEKNWRIGSADQFYDTGLIGFEHEKKSWNGLFSVGKNENVQDKTAVAVMIGEE